MQHEILHFNSISERKKNVHKVLQRKRQPKGAGWVDRCLLHDSLFLLKRFKDFVIIFQDYGQHGFVSY